MVALRKVEVPKKGAEVVRRREERGWRTGRPVEDPEKQKRWGFVTAKPSEFLVHVRRGRVLSSSGQGASCFKWPWDAVAIVPTSLQRLQFVADQVTAEQVGIEVVGLAVYRIAEPLLAYRVLNFSYPERAQEKLEETLTAMFVGATRRLVATLSVAECQTRRKAALAEELLREIAPVVGGEGRADDSTDAGWGVVLDTIEIQEVRVLSERVFAAMQAPFRAGLERAAREAKALADLEVARREAECAREVEAVKIAADTAVRERRAEAERLAAATAAEDRVRAIELERARAEVALRSERALDKARLEAEAEQRAEVLAHDRRTAEAEAELALRRLALSERDARARLESEAVEREAAGLRLERARLEAEASGEVRRIAAEVLRLEGQAKAAVELELARAALARAEAEARVLAVEKLPALAQAIGQRIGEVKIAHYGGDGNPFEVLTRAVSAVVDLGRSTLTPPK